ncbi:ATP-binding protein [Sphingomicrobium astaxanthinifaciens]|uniref:ATP-binding protein n=1 Tax=Sphingomicrobium astaxanthinifaciens TaxID=1227949 RepID=UPI001FCB3C51|nr:ATP-binding protein [Sphingomicrobium astaxanthinifaciens]MCJ7420516.1 ATP-binding protein [Sphingomicrobium astaxanthinifaciens]
MPATISRRAIVILLPFALLVFGLLTWRAYSDAIDREIDAATRALEVDRTETAMALSARIDELERVEARAARMLAARLAAGEGDLARFDRLFPRRGDGTRRGADALWDGTLSAAEGVPPRGFGAFIGSERVSPERQRRLLAAFDVIKAMSEGLPAVVRNLYFFTPENDLVMYAPERSDELVFYRRDAPASLDFQQEEFTLVTQPEANPDGGMRCTSLQPILYDETRRTWTTGCMRPVRLEGRQVGAFGSSIPLEQLIGDPPMAAGDNVKRIVITAEGRLVRHPDYTIQSRAETGEHLQLKETRNPELAALWRLVAGAGTRAGGGYAPGLDAFYSLERLEQPEWFVVSLLPARQVRANALAAARPILIGGIVATLAFVLVSGLFLRHQVVQPLRRLAARADSIALDGEAPPLDGPEGSEIERLNKAFDAMEVRIERERERLARSFDLFADALPDRAIMLLDPDRRLLRGNIGVERILGWNPRRGARVDFLFAPGAEGASEAPRHFAQAREGKLGGEDRRYRHDGTGFWALELLEPIHNAEGELAGYALIIEDRTEARQQRLELEERLRLQQLAEDIAEIGYFVMNDAGEVTLSRSIRDFLNLGECRSVPIDDLVGLLDADRRAEVQVAAQEALEQGKGFQMVVPVSRDGSERRVIEIKAGLRAHEPGARRIFGVVRDVTEQRESEMRIRSALEEARAEAERRMRLMATVSHEIRTPMTGILGMIDLMRHDQRTVSRARALTVIEQSAEALMRVLDDLLEHARAESGTLQIERAPFETDAFIGRVAELFRPLARRKGLQLVERVECRLSLLGDTNRIQQILANFLSNAIKFTASGKVELVVSCESTSDEEAVVRFAVRDSGIGIPADRVEQLFNPFEQADTSTARKFGGTGLGLSICRRLAEAMGGTVGASSVEGEGSEFFLSVPLAIGASSGDQQIGRHRRALVLGASATGRIAAEAQLATLGFAAVASIDELQKGDVILFDGDNLEGEPPVAPDIHLLAQVAELRGAAAARADAVGARILSKPLDADALREALHAALR